MTVAESGGFRPGQKEYRRVLVAFFCAGLATWALLFDAQAVLPRIADDFGVPASSAALAVSFTTLGLAVAVLPWSAVSDRLGRRRAMQVSILATAVVSAASIFTPSLGAFLGMRLLLGLMLAGLPAVSMAYLAEEIAPRHLPQTAGLFVAGNTIGGLLGRIIAGPIGELTDWRTGIGTVSVVGVAAATMFVILIPGSSSAAVRPSSRGAWSSLVRNVLANLRDPRMRVLYALGLIVLGTFTAVYNYLAFRLVDGLGMPATLASVLFLGLAFGTLGSALSGRLVAPWGRRRAVLAGFAIAVVGVLLLVVPIVGVVFVGLALATFGIFVVNAIVYGWAGQRAVVGKAQATALFQLSTQTGNALIGWGAGIVFGAFGWGATVAALLVLLGLGVLLAVWGLAPEAGGGRALSGSVPVVPSPGALRVEKTGPAPLGGE